jgi:hypothetical protein
MAATNGTRRRTSRGWLGRALRPVVAFAAVALAAGHAPASAQGFIPAGQVAAGSYLTVLIKPDFPYYSQLCPAGYGRPFVFGYAAENTQFNQEKDGAILGLAYFSCQAGANAPRIVVPSPIETGSLVDAGILAGWRWSTSPAFGAVFNKTIDIGGTRRLATVCLDPGTGNCRPPSPPASCPFDAVVTDSALLDALQDLLRAQIGTANIDYAWLVDYGTGKPAAAPGPTNDPAKLRLFVRTGATVACSDGPAITADGVRIEDQLSVTFLTDGTCAYRSGTGRIIYYAC